MRTVEPVTTDHDLHCERIDDPDAITLARRLVAAVYVDEAYINAKDVNDDGVLHDHVDPYYVHSDYFVVGVGPLLDPLAAVSRLIRHDESLSDSSFPMLVGVALDPDFEAIVRAADISSWVEVGSVAKMPGTSVQAPNLLYRKMWQYAVRERHTTWLFAADHRVSRTLQNLFGDEVTPVGPRQHFMGSPTDPLLMHPPTSADWLAEQAANARDDDSMVGQLVRLGLAFFLDGLEPEYFTEEQLDRFAAGGVELREQAVIDLRGDAPVIDIRDGQKSDRL